MSEKERGKRKRTERAKKWREWALIMRFDSESTPHKLRVEGTMCICRHWKMEDMTMKKMKNPEGRERESRFRKAL